MSSLIIMVFIKDKMNMHTNIKIKRKKFTKRDIFHTYKINKYLLFFTNL